MENISIREFRFRELEWRLEARIASRCLLSQAIPIITIKLHLDSETVNENKNKLSDINQSRSLGVAVNDLDENTVLDTRKQQREILFQTDPNNLVNIIDILEKYLVEAKTHLIRNFVKSF